MTTRYSSESDNSEVEDRHSRTSTSSIDDDIARGPNGKVFQKAPVSPSLSPEKDVDGVPQTSFIARVSSLPLIQDSVFTLHSIAKENKYSRLALDTAGSAVETVSKYTEPYQKTLQPHISKVDHIASKSLDLIETTFPIVTKPTAEIVTEIKKPIVYVEESSKNAYTQLQSTIDVHVTAPVKTVTSTIAASVNTHAAPLVDGLETIVNRILPDAEVEQNTAVQSNQAVRMVDITRNASLRVSRRVSISVAPITQQAQDFRKAAEGNAAMVKSKESIQALNVRLNSLVELLRLHANELQANVQKVPGEASHRVQTLSANLLIEIDSLSAYLKENSPKLPEYVQLRLEPLVDFVNDRYVTVKGEIVKPDVPAIQKARNILHLTTEETLPILQEAAQEVKETLLHYQLSLQENVNRGLSKVHEVNSSVTDAAARAVQSARETLVSK